MSQPAKEVKIKNPFGKAQTELFQYILKNPGCSAHQIREDCFPDKTGNYVWNLIRENRHIIDKTDAVNDAMASEYRIKVNSLGAHIDVLYWVHTGKFKAKYVQAALPLKTQQ